MKTAHLCIAIIALLLTPALCQATPPKPHGYMSGFLGVAVIKQADVTTDDYLYNTTYNDKVEFYPGINTGITGGYDFGYFRIEGELSYKSASIKEITDKSDNYRYRSVDGDLGALALMFNGFVDLHNQSAVTPYFGGGVGFATLSLSDTYGTDTRGGITTRELLYIEDNDSVLAAQIGAGVVIELNSVLSLDLGYRYFVTSKARFDSEWDLSTELRVKSHNLLAGLRLKF